jgi:hypothetical protein
MFAHVAPASLSIITHKTRAYRHQRAAHGVAKIAGEIVSAYQRRQWHQWRRNQLIVAGSVWRYNLSVAA